MLQQIKDMSDSKILLQQELDEPNVAAQAVVDMVENSEEDAGAPLSLLERLQRVPQGIMRYLSDTNRQYVSHVLGLVKAYWPQANLAPLGDGMSPDCDEDKFVEYLGEVKLVADRVVDT